MTSRDPNDPNSEHVSVRDEASNDALPVMPSMTDTLNAAHMPRQSTLVDRRVLLICALAIVLGVAAAFIAQALVALIGFVTNVVFYGNTSAALVEPAGNHLGGWVIFIPVIGGLVVGLMARWGSNAIRGHGIPEAMEQVLLNESKIPARVTFWKPISSAIAIGTGGPFGAEGPIIATGGALGSFIGQILRITGSERKVLLAAGASAGMAAIFASPISATILAVELLLFELRPRSLIPVALATVTATGVHYALDGSAAVFAMTDVATPHGTALICYTLLGAVIGLLSVGVTRVVYLIEDGFEKLPVHWMWWPAIGGLAVGIIGYFAPLTLGVGYANIRNIINGHMALGAMAVLCVMKFLSWAIALGSGTSGGTLAPLFTIGGALGGVAGVLLVALAPQLGVDPRIAALVGMAAIFAGSSRALLTSVVFAFETTRLVPGILPLLGGCAAAYLVSALLMRNTIMTEKITRRGVRVPDEYAADYLHQVTVGNACTREVASLRSTQTLGEVRRWMHSGDPSSQYQGYPVIDAESGHVLGMITRRQLLEPNASETTPVGELRSRPAIRVGEHNSLREAADHMVEHAIGRLVVVAENAPTVMTGILTRSDLLAAHGRRLKEGRDISRHIRLWRVDGTQTRQR